MAVGKVPPDDPLAELEASDEEAGALVRDANGDRSPPPPIGDAFEIVLCPPPIKPFIKSALLKFEWVKLASGRRAEELCTGGTWR